MIRKDRATAETTGAARVEREESAIRRWFNQHLERQKRIRGEQLENTTTWKVRSLGNGVWVHEYQRQLRSCRKHKPRDQCYPRSP